MREHSVASSEPVFDETLLTTGADVNSRCVIFYLLSCSPPLQRRIFYSSAVNNVHTERLKNISLAAVRATKPMPLEYCVRSLQFSASISYNSSTFVRIPMRRSRKNPKMLGALETQQTNWIPPWFDFLFFAVDENARCKRGG